jgi:hypothetical protein
MRSAAGPTLFHPPVISSPVQLRGPEAPEATAYWSSPLRQNEEEEVDASEEKRLLTAEQPEVEATVSGLQPYYKEKLNAAETNEDEGYPEGEEEEEVEPFSLLRSSCSSLSSSVSPVESSSLVEGDDPTLTEVSYPDENSLVLQPVEAGDAVSYDPVEAPCSPTSCFGTSLSPPPPMYYAQLTDEDRPVERHAFFGDAGSSQDYTAEFATLTEDVTPPSSGPPPSTPPPHHWWRHLFQQLEHQHSQERSQWQTELQQSAQQQSLLKSELKLTLQQQLRWLEERCLAPQHVLPGIQKEEEEEEDRRRTPETTMESQSSSASASWVAEGRGTLLRGGHEGVTAGDGLEMTYDTSQQVQQIQVLEECVREERLRHEADRAEWIRLLEAAAADTSQAAQQLRTLQLKTTKQQVQAKQWKEKARVLAELLPLTEQQFQTERRAWEQERAAAAAAQTERERVRDALVQQHALALKQVEAQVQGEMEVRLAALREQCQQEQARAVQLVREEAAVQQQRRDEAMAQVQREMQQQNAASERARQEQQESRERLEAQVQSLLEERRTLRADAADFTELATRSKQQCTVLQKHLAAAASSDHPREDEDWESALDRALAERDLYRQEADALRQELDEQRRSNDASSPVAADLALKYKESVEQHSQVVQRLKRMEEQRAAERGTWKCQLEAALAATRDAQVVHEQERSAWSERTAVELQGLQRRWQQSVVDRKRQFDEIIALCSASERGTITEAQVVQHLQQRLQAVEEEMEQRCQVLVTNHFTELKDYKQQIAVLNQTVHNLEQEMEERCARLMEQHHAELSELHERLEEVEQESSETIAALQQEHDPMSDDEDAQTRVVSNQGRGDALAEQKALIHRVDELSQRLAEYKRLHQAATTNYERAILERNSYKEEFEKLRGAKEDGRWEQHQSVVLSAMEEVRADIAAVQTSLTSSQVSSKADEQARWEVLRGDLSNIQSNLNDAVAELTLEADALLHSREVLQTVASDVSEKENATQRRLLDQQEQLLQLVTALRKQITDKEDCTKGEDGLYLDADSYSLSRELIAELQQKEAALATSQTELRHVKEQWASEISARQMADTEIGALNDQADAYEKEIAILQSTNAQLVQKLRHLGLEVSRSPRICRNDSSTLVVLDEALALAEGLTHIVRRDETGAMEMLESMTEMMDEHEMRATSHEVSSPRSDYRRNVFAEDADGIEVIQETDDDSWVDEALGDGKSAGALPWVMEQLYSRCQLLERERVELMEVTLDVLESARAANTAQLDAAVATARRKATEEVLREQSQKERIFHKWCQSYIGKEKHI